MKKLLLLAISSLMSFSLMAVSPDRDKVVNSKVKTLNELMTQAQKYMNSPYAEMAKGPESFDDPGFINFMYKEWGFDLPCNSKKLMNTGKKIKKAKKVKVGDLVFFNYEGRPISGIAYKINGDGVFDFIYVSKEYGVTIGSNAHEPFKDIFVQASRITTDKELKKIRKDYEKEQKAIAKAKKEKEKQEKAEKKAKEKREKEQAKARKEYEKAKKEAAKSNKKMKEAEDRIK